MNFDAKLHIDLSQGIVDVEGDNDLIREVYADFKEKILEQSEFPATSALSETTDTKPEKRSTKAKRRNTGRKTGKSTENPSLISIEKPKRDPDLNTSALGEFYGKFKPKNHQDKILVFLNFLVEVLKIEFPNTDQVYTCYMDTGEKAPTAFSRAFRFAREGKFGYIMFDSPSNLKITIKGEYHLNDLRKGTE